MRPVPLTISPATCSSQIHYLSSGHVLLDTLSARVAYSNLESIVKAVSNSTASFSQDW